MLLLLGLFVFYFFLFRGLGLWVDKGRHAIPLGTVLGVLSGAGFMAIVLYFYHFFAGSTVYLLGLFVLAAGVAWWRYGEIWWINTLSTFKETTFNERLLAVAGFLIITAYSALPSSVIDEGLYYAQAILWFENYGFLKGLANFDYYLGQGSSLHALESLVNMHYLGLRFNDLGGFFTAVWTSNLLLKSKAIGYGKVLVASLGLLSFITLLSASNADMLLYLIATTLFVSTHDQLGLKAIFLLVSLAALSKLSGLILVIWLALQPKVLPKVAAFVLTILVLIKGWFLTGYALFPFLDWQISSVPWQLPQAAFEMQGKLKAIVVYDWPVLESFYESHSQFENIKKLLFGTGFTSIVCWLALVGLILMVLKGFKDSNVKKWFWIITLYFFLWFLFSAQARLILPLLFLPYLALSTKISNSLTGRVLNSAVWLGFLFFLVNPTKLPLRYFYKASKSFSYSFKSDYFLKPAAVWAISADRKKAHVSGYSYYLPPEANYCFYSSFPCTPYFLNDYLVPDSLYAPVLLGEEFCDGFRYQAVAYDTLLLRHYNTLNYKAIRRYFRMPH